MNRKQIVILGCSFAGLTAAYQLQKELKGTHEIIAIDKNPQFTYIPSLIWVPFGWRTVEQISFPLRPALEAKQIRFVQGEVIQIDPEARRIHVRGTADPPSGLQEISYDYLLIATGPKIEFDAVPGLGPNGGQTVSICNGPHALAAQAAWKQFLRAPGPVIVGATQGAACFGAAYEFVFNVAHALRKRGLRGKVPVTYVTAEPFVGHFGIGGLKHAEALTKTFFKRIKIDWVVNSVIECAQDGCVTFRSGQLHHWDRPDLAEDMAGKSLPYKYGMLIPPFLGIDAVRAAKLGNERGFITVNDYFQHVTRPEIFAAGVAVAVATPEPCPAGCAVPKTGYISEVMAKYAARNIAADIQGKPMTPKPTTDIDAKCILDAGSQGMILLTDRVYAPKRRKLQILLPGPWAHWSKLLFEKYYLWKMRTGHVELP